MPFLMKAPYIAAEAYSPPGRLSLFFANPPILE
jgi:hypothetical protein